jgi:hypothetical protein
MAASGRFDDHSEDIEILSTHQKQISWRTSTTKKLVKVRMVMGLKSAAVLGWCAICESIAVNESRFTAA